MNTPLTLQDDTTDLDELMRRATVNTDKLRALAAQLGGAPVNPLDFNGHVPSLPSPDERMVAQAFEQLERLGYAWCSVCGWMPLADDGTGCTHEDGE